MARSLRLSGPALAELLPELRSMPGPVYSAVATAVTALVRDGRVAVETRLPSERDLATALGVSRATVTAAYDALRSDGFLESRTGAGSFVTVPTGSRVRNTLARWDTTTDLQYASSDVIDLSCAALTAPPLVAEAVRDAADRFALYLTMNGYEPSGLPELRAAVAARFTARGVGTRPEQIMITNGALHGLDLLLRLMINPGDRVVTELPTFPGAIDAIQDNSGRIVPVPMAAAGGWRTDQLASTLRQTNARLAYLIPDFHNPTGALVPAADRRVVLDVAKRAGTTVVVDETFAELGFEGGERPTAALDAGVITLGSLSKTVWGGLRIGWIRAGADIIERLAAVRTSIDLGSPVFEQVAATALVERIDEVAAIRRAELVPNRDALVAALHRELPSWTVNPPAGGMSVWAELDAPLSTALSALAAREGLVVVPGPRFGVDGTLERFVRLPFSLRAGAMDEVVRRLATVWGQLDAAAVPGRRQVVA